MERKLRTARYQLAPAPCQRRKEFGNVYCRPFMRALARNRARGAHDVPSLHRRGLDGPNHLFGALVFTQPPRFDLRRNDLQEIVEFVGAPLNPTDRFNAIGLFKRIARRLQLLFGRFTFLRRALEGREVSGMLIQLTFEDPKNVQGQPQCTDGASRKSDRAEPESAPRGRSTGHGSGRHPRPPALQKNAIARAARRQNTLI